jgi:hypothetical protein
MWKDTVRQLVEDVIGALPDDASCASEIGVVVRGTRIIVTLVVDPIFELTLEVWS